MKNIIKMSLVAAVAVAGFSSTVAAKPLEESIKDVDFSGSLRYRYTNGESALEKNEYRLITSVKSKVNDNITAKVTLQGKGATNNESGDADEINYGEVAEAQFIANIAGATVIVGKQALATPFADGSVDGSGGQQGTGIVAMYPVGPVTLAAGWYTNTDAASIYSDTLNKNTTDDTNNNDIGGSNIAAIGVLGSIEAINFNLWYANVSDTDLNIDTNADAFKAGGSLNGTGVTGAQAGADAFNAGADATFGPLNVAFNYAQVDYDVTTLGANVDLDSKQKQTRLMASFDAEVASFTAGVIFAGDDGANVTLGDSDAASNVVMEAFDAASLADTTAYYAKVTAPVGPVTLGLEHGRTSDVNGNEDGDISFTETKLSASYAMSKNFTVSGWITETTGDVDGDTDYSEMGANRIEVKYTF